MIQNFNLHLPICQKSTSIEPYVNKIEPKHFWEHIAFGSYIFPLKATKIQQYLVKSVSIVAFVRENGELGLIWTPLGVLPFKYFYELLDNYFKQLIGRMLTK